MVIRITNYKNYEEINYGLPLIVGEISGVESGELLVNVEKCDTTAVAWPIINGKFKVLVRLNSGINHIKFKQNLNVEELCLCYKPMKFKKFVRLIYIVCQEEGHFQCPPEEDCSVKSACERLSLGVQMLQTFTAEKLRTHGLRRAAFCLEEDIESRPICHVFHSKMCLKDALKLNETELWEYFAVELMTSDLRVGNNCKFLGVLSFSRYENKLSILPKTFKEMRQLTKGYVALGAGGLALLGSASLHAWPCSLQEVPWRFGDDRKIDRMQLLDDSGNRGWFWACYSTNLGAMLHELGHVFDLGHTSSGIMSRGFDNIHKFFIVDLFYCSQPYQKKHNPFYQRCVHEKHHSVKLSQSSSLLWSEKIENKLSAKRPANVKEQNIQMNQTFKKDSTLQMSKKKVTVKPPWRVPNPPENEFYNDTSESNWARSSAIILCYHKWFNDFDEDTENGISRIGSTFSSAHGICIVEYRDDDGMAFHHLEFVSGQTCNELDIVKSDIATYIPENCSEVKVHVQDFRGNIVQHVFHAELFKMCPVQSDENILENATIVCS